MIRIIGTNLRSRRWNKKCKNVVVATLMTGLKGFNGLFSDKKIQQSLREFPFKKILKER